jgi:DNA-directed RNA polymerase specialized sigma24 family protein
MTAEEYGTAYEKGFQFTKRFVYRKGVAWQDAEDAAQAGWARGWERRSQFRDASRIQTWVNQISVNLYLMTELRAKRRLVSLSADLALAAQSAPIIDHIAAAELLRKCPVSSRRILVDFHITGFSTEEIARRERVTPLATRIRLCRARKLARSFIQPIQ